MRRFLQFVDKTFVHLRKMTYFCTQNYKRIADNEKTVISCSSSFYYSFGT